MRNTTFNHYLFDDYSYLAVTIKQLRSLGINLKDLSQFCRFSTSGKTMYLATDHDKYLFDIQYKNKYKKPYSVNFVFTKIPNFSPTFHMPWMYN